MKWAFDKLRGVKADIKIFIFEGEDENWKIVRNAYLKDYAQLSIDEAFIALHWKGDHFEKSWWQPLVNGIHESGDIDFTGF